jgi:hypothetical protein
MLITPCNLQWVIFDGSPESIPIEGKPIIIWDDRQGGFNLGSYKCLLDYTRPYLKVKIKHLEEYERYKIGAMWAYTMEV